MIQHDVATVFNTEGHSNSWWLHHTLLRFLDEPIYVLTCDNIVDLDWERLEKDYEASGSPACMLVPVQPVEGLEGDFIVHDGPIVTAVGRELDSNIYCSGIQILNPKKVSSMTEDRGSFYDIWSQLIEREELHVSEVSGYVDRHRYVGAAEEGQRGLSVASVQSPVRRTLRGPLD